MKAISIAALAAAQLSSAQAAELPGDMIVGQQRGTFAGARVRLQLGGEESGKVRAGLGVEPMDRIDLAGGRGRTRFGEGVELSLARGEAPTLRVGGAPLSPRLAAAEDQEGKKRKSTGDKVLTGAAVVLGVAALGVSALLVAIFVR